MGNREEDVDDVLHDPSSPNALREQTSQAEQARLKLAETMAEASEVCTSLFLYLRPRLRREVWAFLLLPVSSHQGPVTGLLLASRSSTLSTVR